jgi:uncharacterized membrane protein YjfL (UPF0719 family)
VHVHVLYLPQPIAMMSADEWIVTIAAIVLGPGLWAIWLFQVMRFRPLDRRRGPISLVLSTLIACAAVIFCVLTTRASDDVVNAPLYQFMYLVLGLAWLRGSQTFFPYLGLSPRDDVVERGNHAAAIVHSGALVAVALCYAGGNVGNGPGWWVVLFSAAVATSVLLLAWAIVAQLTPVTDAVIIDRDRAAGVRLAVFLVSCGLVSGRGVAGDWQSASATALDFVAIAPGLVVIVALAVALERVCQPTAARPRPAVLTWGIVPSLVYALAAWATLWTVGWLA